MNYINPYILLLIPAVVIAAVFLYSGAARRKKRLLSKLLGTNSAASGAVRLSVSSRRWKFILYLAAMVTIICGIARPYWHKLPVSVNSSGRDIMVLFDVSKSMRATDLPPSRLDQAKYLMREICAAMPGDRFGLTAFAGNAFLSCPLTSDHNAFNEYINELDTDTVPLGGTNIERALRSAERALAAAESNDCALLMLTDGDVLSGDASRLLASLKKRKIPLIIAGFGDPSAAAPVPDGRGGFIRQKDGKAASSRLNEELLRRLASETGGVYFRSSVGDTGASGIIAALKKLKLREGESSVKLQVKDEFPWFFAAGFLLIAAAAAISEVSANPAAKCSFKLITLFFLGLSALLSSGAGAVPAEKNLPQDALQLYNLARERQLKGDSSALQLYEEVISKASGNSELQSRALHNLGVGKHLEGRSDMVKAQQQLGRQQPDGALEELKRAEAKFRDSSAFYRQVLSLDSEENQLAAANLRQFELDMRQLEKLKKEIEKLKKQQQQAQKQAQQAQQQQQKSPQNNSGQNQQQMKQAAESARQLSEQADKLKQQKLRDAASAARKELETAAEKTEQGKSPEEIKKHLDAAVRALGKPEEKKPQPGQDQKKSSEKSGDKEKKENSAAAQQAEEKRKQEEKKRSGEQQLEMLNDEAAKLRKHLRRRNSAGQPSAQVEKDW